MSTISPEDFERLVKGLSDREIIEAAIEAGFLPKRDYWRGERVQIPLWLAELLQKKRAVEICGGQK